MTDFWSNKYPKARKEHICQMCGRVISAGETYRRGTAFDMGTAWSWNECQHCQVLFSYLCNLFGVYDYMEDFVSEWEPETWSEVRVKVNYWRAWRRNDGTLVESPATLLGNHGVGR